MRTVWQAREPQSTRQVLEVLNDGRAKPLAFTTVMTIMSRLTNKGFLIRLGPPRRYTYEAAAPDVAGVAVREVLRAHGDAAVARFAEQARADPKVLRRLRALLAEE